MSETKRRPVGRPPQVMPERIDAAPHLVAWKLLTTRLPDKWGYDRKERK